MKSTLREADFGFEDRILPASRSFPTPSLRVWCTKKKIQSHTPRTQLIEQLKFV